MFLFKLQSSFFFSYIVNSSIFIQVMAEQARQIIAWTNDDPFQWHIYAPQASAK